MVERTSYPKNIRPRKNGFEIRIQRTGATYREFIEGCTVADLNRAEKRRDEMQARLRLGLPVNVLRPESGSTALFQEVAQRFLDTTQAEESTHQNYKEALNKYWMPRFHNHMIAEITHDDILAVMRQPPFSGLAQTTKRSTFAPLRLVFKHARKSRLIESVPTEDIAIKGQAKAHDPYSAQERAKLVAAAKGRSQLIAGILLYSGIRSGELIALEWDDYDNKARTLHINKSRYRSMSKDRTKTFVERKVHVVPELATFSGTIQTGLKED